MIIGVKYKNYRLILGVKNFDNTKLKLIGICENRPNKMTAENEKLLIENSKFITYIL